MSNQSEIETRLADAQTTREKIDALNDLAWELRNLQPERALELTLEAYEMSTSGEFAAQPYRMGQASSLVTRAQIHRQQGKLDLALSQSLQALDLLNSEEPSRVLADCARIIGWIYYSLGNQSEALRYGVSGLKISQTLGLKVQEALALDSLATIHASSGAFEQSVQYHIEAIKIARETGDNVVLAVAINNYALALLQSGEYPRALELSLESLDIIKNTEAAEQKGAILDTVGQTFAKMGKYEQAEEMLMAALESAIANQREMSQTYCLRSMGDLHFIQKNWNVARSWYRQALYVATKIDSHSLQMECHEKLSQIAEQEGLWQEALEQHKIFHELNREVNSDAIHKQLSILKVEHQVETAKRDAEIYHLRNEELSHEIEERKQTEKALRESQARFSTVFHSSPIGIGISHIEGKFLDVNDAFCKLFGYTYDDLVGHTGIELGLWVDLHQREEMFQLLRSGGSAKNLEIQFKRKSGEIIDVMFGVDLIELEGDQYLLALLLDITELKRLQMQGIERSALEERQRLARDLHDAVSQTLFSALVISDITLQQKKTIGPRVLWKNINHLAKLVRSALGEMRVLLLELRPESLASADLHTLLSRLVDAASSRTEAKIHLHAQEKSELPVDVKIAFYRIAQEALNNIIKHAACSRVDIRFQFQSGVAELAVEDNGIGFESDEVEGSQMGLKIMHERADAIGARLQVSNRIWQGTQVSCTWKTGV